MAYSGNETLPLSNREYTKQNDRTTLPKERFSNEVEFLLPRASQEKVAARIKEYINSLDGFLSPQTARSPRAVGDTLESLVADRFESFLGDWCSEYSNKFARRAMADMAFTDVQGIYSVIDVKTHREGTSFNIPNLISVERLARFYESDANVFSLVMIKYSIEVNDLEVSDVLFTPIEFLDWKCLTVGALGWGQIQIANSNNIRSIERNSRKEWMLQLCDVMITRVLDKGPRAAALELAWDFGQPDGKRGEDERTPAVACC